MLALLLGTTDEKLYAPNNRRTTPARDDNNNVYIREVVTSHI